MEYKIKKSNENYLGRSSGLWNKVVMYGTGLALLANSSGCVDSVNGFRIRADEEPVYVRYNGEIPKPKEDEKKEKEWYENPYIVGGIAVGAVGVGVGTYFLVKELEGGKKTFPSPEEGLFGGGENGGGPGGQ